MNDNQILEAMGISDSVDDSIKKQALHSLHQTVVLKFSQAAAQLLTDNQLKQFEELQEKGTSDEELDKWFSEVLPERSELREAIYKDTIEEIRTRLDKIVSE